MIFIANVLVMNGGTTFLIRTCRALAAQGESCTVLLLRPLFDAQLRCELERHARVVCLQDYLCESGKAFRAHFGVFGWVDWIALRRSLRSKQQVHAMGIFGLIFALRMAQQGIVERVTAGVYHQNEFMFHAPPFYFAREAIRQFAALPPANVVFFNEGTRDNYERFFGSNYTAATIIPIGVELPTQAGISPLSLPQRVVSVGNLVNFKTYNRHVIELLPQLTAQHPDITYEIYGDGPEESNLRKLAGDLAVEKHVVFRGAIPYSDFPKAIHGAALFVGSGTALIEAAAAGIPALVGIESIKTPETYGFLSDVDGLTYNEYLADRPKQSMQSLVEKVLVDAEYHRRVSLACQRKAREFSVETTARGLLALNASAEPLATRPLGRARFVRMMCSLVGLAFFERMGWITAFSNRRDQSF